MSNRYAAALASGNGTPLVCARSMRTTVRPRDALVRVFRAIWPHNTAAELAARTDVSVRSAEHWLAGRSGMSLDAFAALLRSDAGFEALEAAMGDARPDWYATLRRRVREERIEAQLQALAAEMAEIKQERARAAKSAR